MASRVEIRCINKTDRQNPHERIRRIGGVNPNNSRWSLSQQDAIAGIEQGTYEFYVSRGGNTVGVVVATSAAGHKYIKTAADGLQPDNLLSLPECP